MAAPLGEQLNLARDYTRKLSEVIQEQARDLDSQATR